MSPCFGAILAATLAQNGNQTEITPGGHFSIPRRPERTYPRPAIKPAEAREVPKQMAHPDRPISRNYAKTARRLVQYGSMAGRICACGFACHGRRHCCAAHQVVRNGPAGYFCPPRADLGSKCHLQKSGKVLTFCGRNGLAINSQRRSYVRGHRGKTRARKSIFKKYTTRKTNVDFFCGFSSDSFLVFFGREMAPKFQNANLKWP